jgi:hypothetical protein
VTRRHGARSDAKPPRYRGDDDHLGRPRRGRARRRRGSQRRAACLQREGDTCGRRAIASVSRGRLAARSRSSSPTTGRHANCRGIGGIRLISHPTNRDSGSARCTGTPAVRPGRRVNRRRRDASQRRDAALVKELDGWAKSSARDARRKTRCRVTRAGKVVHPRVGQLPHRDRHRQTQLRLARVRARRGDEISPHRVLVRYHTGDVVPRQRLPRGVHSGRLLPLAGHTKFHWWRTPSASFCRSCTRRSPTTCSRCSFRSASCCSHSRPGELIYDWIDKDLRLPTHTLLILFAVLESITVGLLARFDRANEQRCPRFSGITSTGAMSTSGTPSSCSHSA